MVVRAQVPFGETVSVFNPTTGTFTPIPLNDDLFCHGNILLEDGRVLAVGGDFYPSPASQGLGNGFQKQRFFNPQSNSWSYANDMIDRRWYPSMLRLPDGDVLIAAGLSVDYATCSASFEIYQPGRNVNVYNISTLHQKDGICGYPPLLYIPGSGNIFHLARDWNIINKQFEVLEQSTNRMPNTMAYIFTMLALDPANNYHTDVMVFGGTVDVRPWAAGTQIYRLPITRPGAKSWVLEEDRLPVGRNLAVASLQPNGKILIFGGCRFGNFQYTLASTTHALLYDPYAPAGKRITVLAQSPFERLYHSAAILMPDGRVTIAGGGLSS
jgi:hypothetical protein